MKKAMNTPNPVNEIPIESAQHRQSHQLKIPAGWLPLKMSDGCLTGYWVSVRRWLQLRSHQGHVDARWLNAGSMQ
ncbi:uncharacterized protein LACBIDRAFT_314924 [Laccaria bicolor S238N-H82]|uniref:Predicted protein n=1 Tax=Laccaria bicolor (strain S238N-H82 / ATCC MYA-4686) TaxID=486041 RepID=B0DZG7_LACBS|nr:uncharacterized protein LACBIDRAFT_314924 [Laccaria bicolor S238N-H82]EDR00016.1 predicted protein [Laccaria bicolor S238N-H82]|eukprot:XP_001889325.1 predicted protein [Laccaria bicolor S238N-H82]